MIYGLIVAISCLLVYITIFNLMHISMFQEGTKSKPNYEMNISTGPASNQDVLKVPETNKKSQKMKLKKDFRMLIKSYSHL